MASGVQLISTGAAWRPIQLCRHSLRHFFASAQIALGTNIKYISTQLGHASVTITVDRYGHLFPDEHRVAARRLESRVAAGM